MGENCKSVVVQRGKISKVFNEDLMGPTKYFVATLSCLYSLIADTDTLFPSVFCIYQEVC